MKIKLSKNFNSNIRIGNKSVKKDEVYELPDRDAQSLIDRYGFEPASEAKKAEKKPEKKEVEKKVDEV